MSNDAKQRRKQRRKQRQKQKRNQVNLLRECDRCESINEASQEARKLVAELLQKSRAGDEVAFAKVRHLVPKLPQEVLDALGPTTKSDAYYAKLMNGNDLVGGELQILRTRQLRQDLLEEGDSPMERLLVDEITESHLDLQFARDFHLKHLEKESNLTFSDRRLAACLRRFLAASQALERLRNSRRRSQTKGDLRLTEVQLQNRLQALMN